MKESEPVRPSSNDAFRPSSIREGSVEGSGSPSGPPTRSSSLWDKRPDLH